MPYQIRHKESGQIIKMSSGKSVWSKPGHAKASLRTSGVGWNHCRELGLKDRHYIFDKSTDLFEIVEIVEADKARYCFAKDDDGHNYMIPALENDSFYDALLSGEDDGYAEFNSTYGQYRIDSVTNWTFTDPREDA